MWVLQRTINLSALVRCSTSRLCAFMAALSVRCATDGSSRDTYGMYKNGNSSGPGPRLMWADTLVGNDVYNCQDEDIGDIKEIMLDTVSGKVCYAVLSFDSILGMGEKLFAVPWAALKLDTEHKRFVLDVNKDRLKDAPGFDKAHWPDMADNSWSNDIHSYYRTKPFDQAHRSYE